MYKKSVKSLALISAFVSTNMLLCMQDQIKIEAQKRGVAFAQAQKARQEAWNNMTTAQQREALRQLWEDPEYQAAQAVYKKERAEYEKRNQAWVILSKRLSQLKRTGQEFRFSSNPWPTLVEPTSEEFENLRTAEQAAREQQEKAWDSSQNAQAQYEAIAQKKVPTTKRWANQPMLYLVQSYLLTPYMLDSSTTEIIKEFVRPNMAPVEQYCAQELTKIMEAEKNRPSDPALEQEWAQNIAKMRLDLYLTLESFLDAFKDEDPSN